MTKRPSEAEFGVALRGVDLRMFVYRPADARAGSAITQARPCDWMVWQDGGPAEYGEHRRVDVAWFECKDTDAAETFNLNEIRPGQRLGMVAARRIGIPYWLAVYWRRHKAWTISDALKAGMDSVEYRPNESVVSFTRTELMVRFGVDSSRANLASTLKNVLLGEV